MDSELLLLNVKEDIIASEISVKRPYPNPFNSNTTYIIDVSNGSSIRLDIFNILGKKVKSINKKVFPQGAHKITWNAKNDIGESVESGVYLYELFINNRLQTGKLLYMK
jgi:flagellar hook assembly protein FlgD